MERCHECKFSWNDENFELRENAIKNYHEMDKIDGIEKMLLLKGHLKTLQC